MMSLALWMRITDSGDSAVLLPVATAVLAVLALSGAYRTALAWSVALGACLTTMLTLKLGFQTCGDLVADGLVTSPSGHTALSATVYGCLAVLVARRLADHRPLALGVGLAAAGWVLAIAVSRVVLATHNPAETVIGLCVGGLCVAAFAAISNPAQIRSVPVVRAALAALCLAILTYGQHALAEELIIKAATVLRDQIPACQ